MLMVDKNIRALIRTEADASHIRQAGLDNGMNILRISGAIKIAEGVTTIEEVLRVSPQNEE
jgi:general secretion pathway protein E